MRRLSVVDTMLLGAVLLWALNITVTKYMLTHGWKPLSYATIRYFAAIALFWAFTYRRERSFRIDRRDLPLVLVAALMLFLNQLCFVYALDLAHASTVSLLMAATPIVIGLMTIALRIERLQRSFWVGAFVTLGGVGAIALASGGGSFASGLAGDLLAMGLIITWSGYSIAVAPLLKRYSPYRISALVLGIGWLPLALVGIPQVTAQHFHFGWLVWIGFAYAVVGPLFLTNILWFKAMDRVGASRASLFANLQPFFAVLFALLLLSETLHPLELVGGALIFAGIAIERLRRRPRLVDVAGGPE